MSNAPIKKEIAFKENTESYLSPGFILRSNSHFSSSFCTCGDWISNKAIKLLCPMETQHPALKDKLLDFFKENM